MSAPTYAYDPHSMEFVAQRLHATNNSIQTGLVNLQTAAEAKMSQWTGVAQQAYREHKQKWDQTMMDMNNILGEKTAPALLNMLERMQGTERRNMMMWQ